MTNFAEPILITSYVLLWAIVVLHSVLLIMLLHAYSEGLGRSAGGRAAIYGPIEGTSAPWLDGLDDESGDSRVTPQIVLFMTTQCRPCLQARPAIAAFANHEKRVKLIVVCGGSESRLAAFVAELPSTVRVVPDPEGETAARWRIRPTPFAVAVDSGGMVRAKSATVGAYDLDYLAKAVVGGGNDR